MEKIDRVNLRDIWKMRNFTVKEFLDNLSTHPELKFLLTAAGAWWLLRMVLSIVIAANVIYYIYRIFNLG